MELRTPEDVGMAASGGTEDVGGKAAVSGARFDQVEHVDRRARGNIRGLLRVPCALRRNRRKNLRHLGDLDLEEVAEHRANVDAGKKIARAAGSLGRAGVITELRVVERELHERGHRQGPAFTDQVYQ